MSSEENKQIISNNADFGRKNIELTLTKRKSFPAVLWVAYRNETDPRVKTTASIVKICRTAWKRKGFNDFSQLGKKFFPSGHKVAVSFKFIAKGDHFPSSFPCLVIFWSQKHPSQ